MTRTHLLGAVLVAAATLLMVLFIPIPQFVVLLITGGLGGLLLRTDS